jgi:hypothetical protein
MPHTELPTAQRDASQPTYRTSTMRPTPPPLRTVNAAVLQLPIFVFIDTSTNLQFRGNINE